MICIIAFLFLVILGIFLLNTETRHNPLDALLKGLCLSQRFIIDKNKGKCYCAYIQEA